MKRLPKLSGFIALLVACLTWSSCDNNNDNLVVDWVPVTLHIFIHDAQGNNLAQPEMPGLTLSFQGTTYDLQSASDRVSSRAIMPRFEGFYYEPEDSSLSTYNYPAHLCFGELDGAADMDEDLILTWPDGSKTTIHYHCSKHNERKLSCKRYWKVDGVKQDSNLVYLTK